jgi:hypothetical protein
VGADHTAFLSTHDNAGYVKLSGSR